jgi:hypothetical protein
VVSFDNTGKRQGGDCMKYFSGILMICFVIFFISFIDGNAATINASSCSRSDVQSAINLASSGDRVTVPAGSCTWTAAVTYSKGIILQGTGIDQTNITMGFSSNSGMIEISPDFQHSIVITGFTFKDSASSGGTLINIHNWETQSWDSFPKFRIYKNKFVGQCNGTAFRMATSIHSDEIYGLIDRNSFNNASQEVIQVFADYSTWSKDTNAGKEQAVYIEDNYFTQSCKTSNNPSHAIMGGGGGRYVFRYNEVHNMNIDAHGYGSDSGKAVRWYEIYKNKSFLDAGFNITDWMFIRGGTGVIYDNNYTKDPAANLQYHIRLTEYRVDNASGYGISPDEGCCCAAVHEGYPCYTQIGRGKDLTSEPLYIWNNKVNGLTASIDILDFGNDCDSQCGKVQLMSDYIQANREYYNGTQKPGYTSYFYPHPLTGTMAINIKETYSYASVWEKFIGKIYTYLLTAMNFYGKEIVTITENGTVFINTTSIALCESTNGSYYINPSDGKLYIHCTDGNDPKTHLIEIYYK